MEHAETIAPDAQDDKAKRAEIALRAIEAGFPFNPVQVERGSEARRFLFAAAHHGTREDSPLGNFPGKFAWIAVVLFVLSVLIALAG